MDRVGLERRFAKQLLGKPWRSRLEPKSMNRCSLGIFPEKAPVKSENIQPTPRPKDIARRQRESTEANCIKVFIRDQKIISISHA